MGGGEGWEVQPPPSLPLLFRALTPAPPVHFPFPRPLPWVVISPSRPFLPLPLLLLTRSGSYAPAGLGLSGWGWYRVRRSGRLVRPQECSGYLGGWPMR